MYDLLTLTLILFSPYGETPAAREVPDAWRRPERDAANSLYFLLKFHGKSVDYEEVCTALGEGRGSLGAIQDLAGDFGLELGAFKLSPSDLEKLNEPVIAYSDPGVGEGSFAIILNTVGSAKSSGTIAKVNCASAMIRTESTDEFLRDWTGHVLMTRPKSLMPIWAYAAMGALAAAVGLMLTRSARRKAQQ